MMKTTDWPRGVFPVLKWKAEHADIIGPSRHAAALVYNGFMIALGESQRKTHPMMKEFSKDESKISLHAEVDAITKGVRILGEDLSDCSLYVLRLSRGGNISMSKPCPICQKAINAFGISHVHWSVSDVD